MGIYFENNKGKIYHGDVMATLKDFPDASVNCVITSPPYFQVRDYGFDNQWGQEETFEEYLDHLWYMMHELKRVITDDGTVWINIGDVYSNSGGSGSSKEYQQKHTQFGKVINSGTRQKPRKVKNLPSKCLLMLPSRFAIGCVDRGWILRNDIIWHKSNPMPESVTDRFSKKFEHIFLMTKNKNYHFNLDGVRLPQKDWGRRDRTNGKYVKIGLHSSNSFTGKINPLGKNPGDVWKVSTKSSKTNHYASYNDELIEMPIKAGCPKNGVVLDPFCGTGTTLITAMKLGRRFIGIDGLEEYCKISKKGIKNMGLLNYM